MRIRPFKKEDLDGLDAIEGPEMFTDELKQAIEDSGLAATGIKNGKVMGCGGLHPTDMEHAVLWARLSKDCKNHRIESVRFMKAGLEVLESSFSFKQIDAIVKCGFKEGLRLVRFLGFTHTQIVDGWNIYSKRI